MKYDQVDSLVYFYKMMAQELEASKEECPAFLPQYLGISPYSMHQESQALGKVTAAEYTSDKDHSSACIYVNLNPEGSKWINFIKKKIDMDEVIQRLTFNSHYGMYVEERPKFNLKNYLYFKNGEGTKMTQAEITYEAQKHELDQEEAAEFNQLLADQAAARHNLKTKYDQKRFDLEKLKEDAENKEKADAHAKAVKDTYDAYIAQGFTKTQAESFVKIALENLKT